VRQTREEYLIKGRTSIGVYRTGGEEGRENRECVKDEVRRHLGFSFIGFSTALLWGHVSHFCKDIFSFHVLLFFLI
jgi:hypothetical protein